MPNSVLSPTRTELLDALVRVGGPLYRYVLENGTQAELDGVVGALGRMPWCYDAEAITRLVLEGIVTHLRASRALVFLRSSESGDYSYAGGISRNAASLPVSPAPLTDDDPVVNCVAKGGEQTVVLRAGDARYRAWLDAVFPAPPPGSLLIPLRSAEQPIGFILVDDHGSENETATASRRPAFSLLANLAGVLLGRLLGHESPNGHSAEPGRVVCSASESETPSPPGRTRFYDLVGASEVMQNVFSLLCRVARVDVPVLVVGETGTGKELAARALHLASRRSSGPFVSVNCASIPSELVESELFGHERGAFTGSVRTRPGRVELAEGGVLFLDEIAEMPITLQAKLLRFLQERTYERVGGTRSFQSNVRIVAATNRDIESAVRENRLRRDLLYRLNTFTIELPPLRERLEDIPLLVEHFLDAANARYATTIGRVDPRVLAILESYTWPGNVRELKNVIDRAVILSTGDTLTPESIQLATVAAAPTDSTSMNMLTQVSSDRSLTDLRDDLASHFEKNYIQQLLRQHGGNISQAARAAQINRKNFSDKMKRYGLTREDYA